MSPSQSEKTARSRRGLWLLLLLAAALAVIAVILLVERGGAVRKAEVVEYGMLNERDVPTAIAVAPDGSAWFTIDLSDAIGRVRNGKIEANMAPEYGATIGFFPVDEETLRYLRLTGRPGDLVDLVERYCKEQGLFRTADTPDPLFTDTLDLDLGKVEPSLAGPKRPQDRVPLREMQRTFQTALAAPVKERGYELKESDIAKKAMMGTNGGAIEMSHGAVVIAAITSCTNTSNPSVMVGAGLVAKKAVERGMKVKPYVKTILAPGSRVVTDYLERAGLLEPLSAAEVRHPDGRVVHRPVRLRQHVVLQVGNLSEHGPDRALAFALQLDVLALGNLDDLSFGFAGQPGLERHRPEFQLLGGQRIGQVVIATNSVRPIANAVRGQWCAVRSK